MKFKFIDTLTAAITRNGSLLCVGLDPEVGRMPDDVLPGAPDVARVKAFCLNIIEQTRDRVCCYKPNSAFFEQYGPEGMDALRDVIAACHAVEVPVLLDAKRGDIGNTAKAYARAAFEVLNADAITLSPYLGRDSIAPFLAYEGKAVFVLCYTSNPSAAEIQQHGVPPLFAHIATAAQMWGDTDRSAAQIGFVVGATQVEALRTVRQLAPKHWILAPGIGAQGGNLADALAAGLDADGSGLIVPVSRAVLYAGSPRAAAEHLRDAINQQRHPVTPAPSLPCFLENSELRITNYESNFHPTAGERTGLMSHSSASSLPLVRALYEAGCIQFGEFTLASGKRSPIYIDLRRVISFPALFQQVVGAYTAIVKTLTFDRIAAVPYAALPAAAAVALQLGQPMIYPRKEVKAHGTGQAIEGAYEPGQVTVAIEDVITSGGSLLTAIGTLQEAGLKVNDVVVLVDREQGGKAALAESGHCLHAVLTIGQILETLRDEKVISAATFEDVKAYLGKVQKPCLSD
ncbi:MAG: orotidine-5'-phosphate decarboxylase [Anaerolineae bacterium]|nr:orotidine-5'-phosphate decarboxylase [Anaerolineae bacterium]